jgi:hypothetical protein
MSPGKTSNPKRGRVERLTSTTFFVVLVVMSALVVSPLILMGLASSVFLMVPVAAALPFLLLAGGGVAGLIGLLVGHMPDEWLRRGIIQAAIVLLVLGMVSALIVITAVVLFLAGPLESGDITAAAIILVPHAVLIVAACGSIQRMMRVYAACR